MDSMRAFLAKLSCAVLCVVQISCSSLPPGSNAQDSIQGFFFEPNGGMLLIVGSRHHYLFPHNTELKAALELKDREKIRASFGLFTVTPRNEISGVYTLRVEAAALTPAQAAILRQNYFVLHEGDFLRSAKITGIRYDGRNATLPGLIPFSRPYVIGIKEPAGSSAPAPTPVHVASGEVLIGLAVAVPVCVIGALVGGRCLSF